MKRSWMVLLVCLAVGGVHGSELFPDGKFGGLVKGANIDASATVGGYSIYQNAVGWKLEEGKSDLLIGPSTIPMGIVGMNHSESNFWIANQLVVANLAPRANGGIWRGGACSTNTLYKRTGRNGSAETCVVVNPISVSLGNRNVVAFEVTVSETGVNSAYYKTSLWLNVEAFGFRGTNTGDWTEQALAASPRRKGFFDRLIAWSQTLSEAVEQAFFDKERGAEIFAKVPSYLSLMTVPSDLQDKKLSREFLGAAVDLAERPAYSAIAYSPTGPGITRWTSSWEKITQDDADALALASCERERSPSRPPCVLYKPQENANSAADTK